MDEFNRESASDPGTASSTGTAARMKRNVSDKAADAKEALNDLGRKAADKFEDSRQSTASALERGASSLHSTSDQLSDFGHTAADRIQSTADYVRQTDLRGMAEDIQDVVKRYPGASLAVAAVLGFIIARSLRSSD
jgi:ElaB/YqjD/DUF883 family membrane-anchored ribosome-binding protein